jgi:hypothetical protein
MLAEPQVSELLLVVAAGVLGWSMGLVLAWLTDCVLRVDGAPLKHPGQLLVREPLLQTGVAATWMVLVAVGGLTWQVGAGALVAVPLVQVAVTDLRYGYVYTVVAGCGIALSVALAPVVHMANPWTGLVGAAVGLVSMSLLTMFGRAGSGEAMGRGDIAIATMVGAAAGPGVLVAIGVGLVLNGVLGLCVLLSRRSRVARMAYGPGLCVGGLILLVFR